MGWYYLSISELKRCPYTNKGQMNAFLTHWGRDKTATILQTTFSNAFSWIKICEFWLMFHWILFLRVNYTIFQYWFRLWLGADQATSHYLNQWWSVYWCICAPLGHSEWRQSYWETFEHPVTPVVKNIFNWDTMISTAFSKGSIFPVLFFFISFTVIIVIIKFDIVATIRGKT